MVTPTHEASEIDAGKARLVLVHLMGRVAARDSIALERLYGLTSGKLLGLLIQIVRERPVAEDLLQETFSKVWQNAGRFDPAISSPITWMAAIARNVAIDKLRKDRASLSCVELSDDFELASPGPDALRSMVARDDETRLRNCLNCLEADQQRAIRAAFFGGHTYEVLASREGVPLSTMKSRVRRGLQKLRECLGNE